MKRPAFQFYPADWRKDLELQACSIAARGLWVELMCVMHESERYGHLYLNGKPMNEVQAAAACRITVGIYRKLVAELKGAGVPGVDDKGAIYSRRMVRDEALRIARAAGGGAGAEHGAKGAEHGKKGGRPKKETGDKKPPLIPPPSSSSSSSPSGYETGASAPDAPAGAERLPCPHEQIIDLYHEILPTCPRVAEWTDARQGLLRARWREKSKPNGKSQGYATAEAGLAYWRRYFAYVAQSDFLTGKIDPQPGRPPFLASLEWLLKPSNFAKVV